MKNQSVAFAICATACFPGVALSQVAETGAAAASGELTEVVVTGSRIRGAAPVGSSVIGLDRMAIVDSSGVTVDRIIKEIPQVFDLGVSESSRGQAGGSGNIVFGNSVNLRGIGPYATLVLLDGHRTITNSRSVDPSIVPSLGLERIEIVPDGASAVYGSDAVAGVVNLIPRRNLDGVETSVRYGVADEFDERQIGIAAGKVWDDGQVMVAFEHAFRSNLNGADRDFFTADQRGFGGNDYRVTRCSPGTIRAGGVTFAIPEGGVTPASAASLVPGSANLCDDLQGQDLLPEQKYNSFNATYTQALTDRIELFADGFYSKREFERRSGASASTLNVPNTNAFFVAPPGVTATSYSIDYNFVNDFPPNLQVGSAESWQITPGLRFELPREFQLEVLYSYGENEDNSDTWHGLNNAALAGALASSDPATAFDPYGLGRTSAEVLSTINNQIFLAPTLNTFKGYEARIDGPLFDLPGGSVRIATGYEGQEHEVSLGLARGNPGTPMTFRDFSRRVDSGYLEVLLPIVGAANAVTGVNRLDLTASVRYDKYDDVGSTTNPKFGFNWAPVSGVTFRGSYGTSFRAPLISEIYGNSNALFGQSYQNPAGGPPLSGFALSGGNNDLKPEEATTWSVGLDWEPTLDTRVSLTYFDIEYEKQVANYLSNLAVLNLEDEFAGTGVILRGAAARDRVLQLLAEGITLARGSFPGGDPNNVTLFVDGRNNNLGKSITRGIDLELSQRWETAAAGDFLFRLGGSYLTDYDVAITAAGTQTDRLNTIFNPLKLKSRASVTWDYGPVTTQLAVHYVGGYDNNAITPTHRVDDYAPVDVSVRLNGGELPALGAFGDGLSLGLEVRNAFDTDPPYVNIAQSVNGGGGGYDPTASNPIGRLVAVTLRKSW